MSKICKGTWVEIENVVLNPDERADSLPEETRQVPYMLRVSGFYRRKLSQQEVRICTLIGRELAGTLRVINPSYTHSFGETVPELLKIGIRCECTGDAADNPQGGAQ